MVQEAEPDRILLFHNLQAPPPREFPLPFLLKVESFIGGGAPLVEEQICQHNPSVMKISNLNSNAPLPPPTRSWKSPREARGGGAERPASFASDCNGLAREKEMPAIWLLQGSC